MSSDEQDDDKTIVSPHHSEYAASESGSSLHKIKTGKTKLPEAKDYVVMLLNIIMSIPLYI